MTAAVETQTTTQYPVHYKTVRVNDLDIFYREAGPKNAPVILLLHGFPTSSNMFRNLIPRLAGSFRVIAPDYPGYGQSSMPDHKSFEYSFENLAQHRRRLRRVTRADQVLDVRHGLRRADWLPAGAAASGTDSGADRAERQRVRRRAARVLGPHQEVLGRSDSGKPGRAVLPERREIHQAGSTKTAYRTLRCSTRPRGWWIKLAWIGPEISISRWT